MTLFYKQDLAKALPVDEDDVLDVDDVDQIVDKYIPLYEEPMNQPSPTSRTSELENQEDFFLCILTKNPNNQ
ncbi:unnamed protein product [Brachionus calyciflorus]|uniref:Uncharacterized protein n=1 Tax=Brachionus calyciflorus TaxID=104777 RepID=A0A814MR74_9BILA|nr:unnamed protein product [Brachionus calyciflorus]